MQTENVFIAHPTREQANALKAFFKALKIKFEVTTNDNIYNPEFVAKIIESEKQIAEGRSKRIKREDLKQYLGL